MNYKKIEDLFVDFILNKIGPNTERENERNNNLSIVQTIILNILTKRLPDYNSYVLPYGSFPIKTYLKNADIDITIVFESKAEKKILIDLPTDLIDKTITIIKDELERHSKEQSFELISEIKFIKADIRLLKCKIGSINIDISINNFAGLYKILFISYIEKQLEIQFNKHSLFNDNSFKENKINIFRRVILLIKGWCFYEGNLMGSNVGLMASYTLEILIIYFFNLYYDEINNEFDAFEKFFELMGQFIWEDNIITLYGIISNFNFFQKLQDFNNNNNILIDKIKKYNINIQKDDQTKIYKDLLRIINEPFWYLTNNINAKEENNIINTLSNKSNEPLLKIVELKQLISSINSGLGNINIAKEEKIKGDNFHKYINVLDPLNNSNNLGKSINYNSFSKMKSAINKINKQLKYIQDIRKRTNPYLYMNSLLNLFKITLSTAYLELFKNFLNADLISNSIIYKKYNKNEKQKISIDKNEMKKFNILFLDNPENAENIILEDEDFDDYVEEENIEEEDDSNKNNIEEEDNDEYEEEEEEKKEDYEIYDKDKDETEQNMEIKEYINFEQMLNNDIIKDLLELDGNKQNNVKYYDNFLEESKNYCDKLENLLKSHKLI